MSEMLSQAELEALFGGEESEGATEGGANVIDADDFLKGDDPSNDFSPAEIDAIGEIGNISMGNSATTLFALINHQVDITTPKVMVSSLSKIAASYSAPLVLVKVEYTEGLSGSNLLVLKESDVMLITDLMMGGDGSGAEGDITELHLSAISEAMNQMIGTSSTSLSNILNKKIDISPPIATSIKLNSGEEFKIAAGMDPDEKMAVVSFDMSVKGFLETKIMQILPIKFAKDMISQVVGKGPIGEAQPGSGQAVGQDSGQAAASAAQGIPAGQATTSQQPQQQTAAQQPVQQGQPPYGPPPQYGTPPYPPQGGYAQQPQQYMQPPQQYINVQPASFQSFDDEVLTFDKKNIGLVMDVQLEISVELGRTHRLIRDILEFGQGSIIELDKLAGEPVDILVNGKMIAKGEVVVIDESFGVRVVDIIHPSKRL
ncbi:MAG: flagellar motor switch phosphatase FliY [Oscillospiraceae bacterium]|nr:flagellar motor switch phosphatase FliY [Oscillospiraceae bacterium]